MVIGLGVGVGVAAGVGVGVAVGVGVGVGVGVAVGVELVEALGMVWELGLWSASEWVWVLLLAPGLLRHRCRR